MATEPYPGIAGAPSLGYANTASVSPSDSVDLTNITRALWVGGAGNLVVIDAAGNTTTFTGVTAGALLPIRVSRVKATLTTATNIVALW